jgi:penicillin-binding protein 2
MKNIASIRNYFDNWRLNVFFIIMIVVFGYYLFKLFELQIVQGKDYLAQADENRITKISEPTIRGNIYDRNNFLLAGNIPSYNISITPAYLPEDTGALQSVYRELSALIGVPVSAGEINDETVRNFSPCNTDLGISEIVEIGNTNAPFKPIQVKCDVPEQIAMIIRGKAGDWPGVIVEIQPIRDYPTGNLTSEVIGFLGPIPAIYEADFVAKGFVPRRDKVGYAGVESQFQDELAGKNGERLVEVDVAGQEIRNLEAPIDPVPGNSIRLTIDTRLQIGRAHV